MFQAIENKTLELYVSLMSKLANLREDERGQTSAEYVAVTAVAVLIAITVLYVAFTGTLTNAVSTIGAELDGWVSDSFAAL